jgi:hypothetical protein
MSKAPRIRTADLHCDSCGQLPEVPRTRLTVANILTVLPIELAVHAAVVNTGLAYGEKVLVLAVAATATVIWVAEPSARMLLRSWLHAPALRRRRTLDASPSLWRIRTVLPDEPGALKGVTQGLSRIDVNILAIHVHPAPVGVLDELVVSAPGGITEDDLVACVTACGGRDARVWPTSPVALSDGQTRALSLAARVASNPAELPGAVAELLSARLIVDEPGAIGEAGVGARSAALAGAGARDGTVLKVPTVSHVPLVFSRPGEPFTPAESGRAHRLAELAEAVELAQMTRARERHGTA